MVSKEQLLHRTRRKGGFNWIVIKESTSNSLRIDQLTAWIEFLITYRHENNSLIVLIHLTAAKDWLTDSIFIISLNTWESLKKESKVFAINKINYNMANLRSG